MKRSPTVRAEDARVPMRDGALLAADVIRPDDDRRYPVLLMRTPYSRAGLREVSDPLRWAREGWAVVLQDVRGRYDSGGEFRPFHQEVDDGYDSVEWCATQPWSDGRVAMAGASYNGVTQWLAALSGHPALKAIAPVVTAASYRDDWFYEGDAFQLGFPVSWSAMLAASATDSGKGRAKRALALADNWDRLLGSAREQDKLGTLFPEYARWRDGSAAAYLRPLDVTRQLRKVDVAGWHVAGWYDLFCEGTLSAYAGIVSAAPSAYARRSQRLIVGPWTHIGVYGQATAEVDFGLRGSGLAEGLPDQMREFLGAALDGDEVKAGISVFVMGTDDWLDLETWPPVAAEVALYLDEGGRLTWSAPDDTASDHYSHDPADPVPNRGGRTLSPVLPLPGPMDQRPVESRDDVLVYTSDPLDHDLTVIGTVTAQIGFTSTAPRADVMVKVCDVHPDGRSMNVVDGVRRADLTPGRRRAVPVRVGSTAMTFKRGHRIRVSIASSNFPRFDLLPAAEQTVATGGRRPSYLLLPVVTLPSPPPTS